MKNKKSNRNSCPTWYWQHGLHDAEILSINKDTQTGNCLALCLDADGALYDYSVKTIRLYDYKIERLPAIINEPTKKWWYSDDLLPLSSGRYGLEITIVDEKNRKHLFSVTFADAKVERIDIE